MLSMFRSASRYRWSSCLFSRSFSTTRTRSTKFSPFTRRLFNLPPTPPPPSQNHHDLPSFLAYAQRTALPEYSTTYVGTRYEYAVLQSLRRFAFSLHRIGGRDDAGIDLVGTWHLPGLPPIRVIVQCKALRAKLGPNLVRELEGAFQYSPVGWRTTNKVAMLVSPREATKGVRDALTRSGYPLFWIMMEQDTGTIRQVLWNAKVEELGLGALGVDTTYRPNQDGDSDDGEGRMKQDIDLTWDETEIPSMDQVEEDMARKEAQWLAAWGCERLSDETKVELLEMVEAAFPNQAFDVDIHEIGGAKKDEFLKKIKARSLR